VLMAGLGCCVAHKRCRCDVNSWTDAAVLIIVWEPAEHHAIHTCIHNLKTGQLTTTRHIVLSWSIRWMDGYMNKACRQNKLMAEA